MNLFKRDIKKYIIILSVFFIIHPLYESQNQDKDVSLVRTDFFYTLHDGVKLDCTKFAPGFTTNDSLPVIIFCHGFGGTKDDMEGYAKSMAERGCITFTYSMRGQGKSTGYSNMMSRLEMNDLKEFISYIKTNTLVDSNNIGIIGSSQGGIIPLMAACNGENFKFVVSELSSPEFASSWIENGCVKTTLLWALSYDSSKVRYNNNLKRYKDWILSKRLDYRDSLMHYFPIERDFLNRISSLNSPLFCSNSWQDKFFNSLGMMKAVDSISQNKSYELNSFLAYFGVIQGHGSDTISSESTLHSDYMGSWIDHYAFGFDNPDVTQNKIIFSSSLNPVNFHHWNYTNSTFESWPPTGITNKRFYFHCGKVLDTNKDSGNCDTVSFQNDVRDKNMSIQFALNTGFNGNDFNDKFVKTYIYFETTPLENDLKMIGAPKLNLFYTSDADICQFNFQIWEVNEDNTMNFVTRINYTNWHLYTKSVKEANLFGEAHSHIFKKGSRMRIYVTNLDNGPYDAFLGNNPFVLPVLKRAKNVIYMNGDNASFIEFPIMN